MFGHMTNFVANAHWDEVKQLEPSAALDVEMSDVQRTLFNPTYKNVLMGYILYDVKGKGAKQKIAKRRLDAISGNVGSYSKILNSSKRIKMIQEVNQLTATVAEVTADMENQLERKREDAAQKVRDSKAKKEQLRLKEEAKKALLMPKLTATVEAFHSGERPKTDIASLSKLLLFQILKYYYNDTKVRSTTGKDDLVMTLRGYLDAMVSLY